MRALRFAVACLLLLTLPLQGVAAATMVMCAQHRAGGAAAHADAHSQPHGHAHAQAPGNAHASHHDGAVAQEQTTDSPFGHRCAACSLCCLAVALPPPSLEWAGPGPVRTHAPPLPPAHRSPALAGLERPPRR